MKNWVDELNQIILKIRLYTEPVLNIRLWTLLETDPNPIYENKTKKIYYAKVDERFIKSLSSWTIDCIEVLNLLTNKS